MRFFFILVECDFGVIRGFEVIEGIRREIDSLKNFLFFTLWNKLGYSCYFLKLLIFFF